MLNYFASGLLLSKFKTIIKTSALTKFRNYHLFEYRLLLEENLSILLKQNE